MLLKLKALIIHEEKTNEITTVSVVIYSVYKKVRINSIEFIWQAIY
jgi:hypothetical protein